MAAIDDLKSAVESLKTQTDLVIAKIEELKAGGGNNDADIAAAATAINETVAKLNTSIS